MADFRNVFPVRQDPNTTTSEFVTGENANIIIVAKTALFEPKPSLEDSATFVLN
jgi:hypothetical protein